MTGYWPSSKMKRVGTVKLTNICMKAQSSIKFLLIAAYQQLSLRNGTTIYCNNQKVARAGRTNRISSARDDDAHNRRNSVDIAL